MSVYCVFFMANFSILFPHEFHLTDGKMYI